MPIKVKLHGRLRTAAGSDEIELNSNVRTVGDLLNELMSRLGQDEVVTFSILERKN